MNDSTKKNRAAVALGRRGGKAGTGAAKARTTEQARAAARARWNRDAATHLNQGKGQQRHQ